MVVIRSFPFGCTTDHVDAVISTSSYREAGNCGVVWRWADSFRAAGRRRRPLWCPGHLGRRGGHPSPENVRCPIHRPARGQQWRGCRQS